MTLCVVTCALWATPPSALRASHAARVARSFAAAPDLSAPAREPEDETVVAITMAEAAATNLRTPFLPSLTGTCALRRAVSFACCGRDASGGGGPCTTPG